MAGGEGNHSWHHADPACPRHGRRVVLDADAVAAGAKPERGWHPDATWRLIQFLAGVGLVYKVKTPTHREWHIEEPEEAHELLVS